MMDLTTYDAIVVSTSGGKDSQVTVAVVAQLAREQGFPFERITLVHSDLGRAEWKGTAEMAHAQAKHYGLGDRFQVIRRPQGDFLDMVRQRGMWPGMTTRLCTSSLKRDQIKKVVTGLHREWKREHGTRTFRVLDVQGLRAEESTKRAKQSAFERRDDWSNRTREVDTWLPLHAWKIGEVWDRIRADGAPYHFAYDAGMPRLSCVFCIYSTRSALIRAGELNRELLDEYIALEREIDHTFKHGLSLSEIADAIDRGETVDKVENWRA
jgi:3'-phosphoadenosine 5'-phosphosulfate sulfotransferase (PAPS reductase)/FAD synthetase